MRYMNPRLTLTLTLTLLISGIQILMSFVDIRNSFADINTWNSWYQELKFLISTIGIIDIKNYNYCDVALLIPVIHGLDISNNNCWYQQIDFLISGMCAHCWYQQLEFLISTMCGLGQMLRPLSSNIRQLVISTIGIATMAHSWYQELKLLISGIRILNISNSNCWYQECADILDINNSYFWYQQLELLISTIPIPDIRNLFPDIRYSNSWYHWFGINVNSACHRDGTACYRNER